MRNRFDMQLRQLDCELIQLGAMIEHAIAGAAKALLECDAEKAHEVSGLDDGIDQKERDIERLCLKLLLQQQPVARDLRQISAALKMITDMERIGDQAADIAEIAVMLAGRGEPLLGSAHIGDMARATIRMVSDSVDAFVKKDLELTRAVVRYDDVVDDLFDEVKNDLIRFIAQNSACGEQAIDFLMVAKYFERIGDHATNIAEWVEFSITGQHKDETE
ncbi:phosphate signaling complex protein PhoU [Intestinibacillus massiliensis]|nr:phosphate signaling complex protein PhoU [Intestinibacillus massiliensis]